MIGTQNLEYANNAGFLWPPVADALDTFLRRRLGEADAFERVWRLIHLWEATEITLALASLSLLGQERPNSEILRRQREFFYGKSWDPMTETMRETPGAVDGAIDQWINILDEVAKGKDLPGRFLQSLQAFLRQGSIDVAPLVTAWSKTCDVPPDFLERGVVEVRVAMRYVNSFRNRLAHVPFPHDPLAEVCGALELATSQLFGTEPLPTAHEKDGQSSPLTGALRARACFLHGSLFEPIPAGDGPADLQFVFPCQKRNEPQTWPAGALVYIDPMMRPYVLTRVKGVDVCEYTRFRAEANAVLVVPGAALASQLPAPTKRDYVSAEDLSEEESRSKSQPLNTAAALEAIRDGDFDAGIAYFSGRVAQKSDYHVGWLRLGHAKREKAVRLIASDSDSARQLLIEAVEDLTKALSHVDQRYRALAHYERSKTLYRLARLDQADESSRERAVADASEAFRLSDERKYQTWWAYLETHGATSTASAGVRAS